MDLYTFWRKLHGVAWHQNPELAHTGDVNMGHSARIAAMALKLWPDDLSLCAACIMHDAGEWVAGDVPYEAKQRSEMLSGLVARMEAQALTEMGLLGHDTTDPRVKLLDRLDRYLWAHTRAPHVLRRDDWIAARLQLLEMTTAIGENHWKAAKMVHDCIAETYL